MDCKIALLTILNHVDYTTGACRVNEMVGAVLPKEIILLARQAISNETRLTSDVKEKCIRGDSCPYCGGIVE